MTKEQERQEINAIEEAIRDSMPVNCDNLYIQAALGNITKVQEIIESKTIDINTKDFDDKTALYYAVFYSRPEVVKYLLSQGASVLDRFENGYGICHIAVIFAKIEILQALVEKNELVNAKSQNDITPLHLAVQFGEVDKAIHLLSKGSSIEELYLNNNSIFHIAIIFDQEEMIRVIGGFAKTTNTAINPDIKNGTGNTPLHLAVEYGKTEVVRYLVQELGANTSLENRSGQTPMSIARDNQKSETILPSDSETIKLPFEEIIALLSGEIDSSENIYN